MRAILHLLGDQPLAVDIDALPEADDTLLICRNVRTVDGKRPPYIDHSDSTFVFPYGQVRFVEIPIPGERPGEEVARAQEPEPDELEIDEDFLRRVREA